MNITVKVNYPVYFQMEIDNDISEEEKKDKILNMADNMLVSSSIKPWIEYAYSEDENKQFDFELVDRRIER